MTAAMMLQAPLPVPPEKPAMTPVPTMYADMAYEYKLGQESAEDPKAVCPIRANHLYAKARRDAWHEGRKARRKQLGLRVHALQRVDVRRAARGPADE